MKRKTVRDALGLVKKLPEGKVVSFFCPANLLRDLDLLSRKTKNRSAIIQAALQMAMPQIKRNLTASSDALETFGEPLRETPVEKVWKKPTLR